MKKLIVSDNRRYLTWENGAPFLWLADTAWELFHRLRLAEAEEYFANRRRKGFTMIQAVALAELDGLNTPNAYGERPLVNNNPRTPNERYFALVDEMIRLAAEQELMIGLLPTWGDKVETLAHGRGPVIFDAETAAEYGASIGRRYRDRPNIVWINGGDRSGGGANKPIWGALAGGIKAEDPNHLMTFHPCGGMDGRSSSEWFHDAPWLDFNMAQSGHHRRELANCKIITSDYDRTPAKPCLDGEPRYEDHPVDWKPEKGWFDDADVRQAAYWAVFAGAFGHTYGCHPMWQMYAPGREPISFARRHWREALDLPGAGQMIHLRRLLLSKPMLPRAPDQSLIASCGTEAGPDHVRCLRDESNKYAWFYLPFGGELVVDVEKFGAKKLCVLWHDPRTGQVRLEGEIAARGAVQFTAPSAGRGHDWVLQLEDANDN
jgi:hypothetical protein